MKSTTLVDEFEHYSTWREAVYVRVEALRDWLAAQWKAGEAAWTDDARAIFAELELADGARRSLLESETFRMLLAGRPALAAAA